LAGALQNKDTANGAVLLPFAIPGKG
jgi:hypothetical protein